MYLKILAGLVLAAAAFSAQAAAPRYEVVFQGEAPVRVTLDAFGEARAVSQALVAGEPAMRLRLRALDVTGKYLSLQSETRTLTFERLESEGTSLSTPTVTTGTLDLTIKVVGSEQVSLSRSTSAPRTELPLMTVSHLD
jgi:hypothetical protein